jgi:hypothetical protein
VNKKFDLTKGYELILVEKSQEVEFSVNSPKKFKKSFKDFLKDNPLLSGSAIQVGIDSLSAYNKNKNLTARFFAKTYMERKFYDDLIKTLVSTGKFYLNKKIYKNSGIFYEVIKR